MRETEISESQERKINRKRQKHIVRGKDKYRNGNCGTERKSQNSQKGTARKRKK